LQEPARWQSRSLQSLCCCRWLRPHWCTPSMRRNSSVQNPEGSQTYMIARETSMSALVCCVMQDLDRTIRLANSSCLLSSAFGSNFVSGVVMLLALSFGHTLFSKSYLKRFKLHSFILRAMWSRNRSPVPEAPTSLVLDAIPSALHAC
jgi:hypothetical protein